MGPVLLYDCIFVFLKGKWWTNDDSALDYRFNSKHISLKTLFQNNSSCPSPWAAADSRHMVKAPPAESDSNEATAQCSWATQSDQTNRVQSTSALSYALMRCDHELVRAPFFFPHLSRRPSLYQGHFLSGIKTWTYSFYKGVKVHL